MKYVKPLRPYEVFMANIEAGNDKQLIIKDLVESYSLTIGQIRNYGVICAVSALENIYDLGYHVLDRTLRLCVATWEGDIDSLSANMLNGIARLVIAFGDSLKDSQFKEKLGGMSVKRLSRTAKSADPALSVTLRQCCLRTTENANTHYRGTSYMTNHVLRSATPPTRKQKRHISNRILRTLRKAKTLSNNILR